MRGFYEIGIYHTKTGYNVGTLWRSALQLGASGVFTIGRRYKQQASDTYKTTRHLPLRHYVDMESFRQHRPHDALLVGVEIDGVPLSQFKHPKCAVYLLGAEDHGLPMAVKDYCDTIVSIEAVGIASYNVAVAGSIMMYHRMFVGKELH